jgi:hypothetical protein
MTTNMHRLQISLPRRQLEFLVRRARRDGVSVAELIRRLVENEAQASGSSPVDIEAALSFAGLVADEGALIDAQPVSENVDLYLAEASLPRLPSRPKPAQLRRKRSRK